MMSPYEILIRPVLSEKTTLLRESENKQYVFEVAKNATKIQIMRAVESVYSVKPSACNVINVKAKVKNNRPVSKTSFRRGTGKTRTWKKAIISLPAGKVIDKFEGV